MCSDRPGTTTKVLPLEIFFHVLERDSYDFWMRCVRFGGGSERDTHYKSSLADPTNLSKRGLSAFPWRTVRLWKNLIHTRLELPLFNFSHQRRTVRGPLVDRPRLAQ